MNGAPYTDDRCTRYDDVLTGKCDECNTRIEAEYWEDATECPHCGAEP